MSNDNNTPPRKNMRIFVDADACPVKKEIDDIALETETPVFFISTYNHVTKEHLKGTTLTVDNHPESVDLYLLNHCSKGDLIITQDQGLAAALLGKSVFILSFRGTNWTDMDPDVLLLGRYEGVLRKKQRRHGKGPRPYSDTDRRQFSKELRKILLNKEGISEKDTN